MMLSTSSLSPSKSPFSESSPVSCSFSSRSTAQEDPGTVCVSRDRWHKISKHHASVDRDESIKIEASTTFSAEAYRAVRYISLRQSSGLQKWIVSFFCPSIFYSGSWNMLILYPQ